MRTRVSRPVAAITEMPLPTLLGHGGPGGGHSAQGRSHASHRARRHSVTTPSALRPAPRTAPSTTHHAQGHSVTVLSATHRAQPFTAPSHSPRPVPRTAPSATATHHAAAGMAQQNGVSVEERPVAAALSSLQREEKGRREKKTQRAKLTKSINAVSFSGKT